MSGPLTAVGFLTVIPAGGGGQRWAPGASVRWFPAVGLVIGGLLAAASQGIYAAWPPVVGAALLVSVWIAITGALHLDGLGDSADAAFAQVDRAQRLAIMGDVHHGTYAIVAVGMVILLKFAALAALDATGAAASVLLAAVTARCMTVVVMRSFPPARKEGLQQAFRAGATTPALAIAGIVMLSAGLVAFGLPGAAAVGGLAVLAIAAGGFLAARLGGVNGDACGAIIEVVETGAVLASSALILNGWAEAFPAGVAR